MTLEEKAAARDRIAADWLTYCRVGPSGFDWDYDSRDTMRELTGEQVIWWYA